MMMALQMLIFIPVDDNQNEALAYSTKVLQANKKKKVADYTE